MKSISFRKDLIGVQDELLRFAYKLTTDREEANDLLQETSLKALDNEDKYMPDTNFKGWMYTIMRNIFINNYRKTVRDQTFVDQTDNLFHLNLPQDSGFDSTEGAYDLKEIHRIVNALPKDYRVPFAMYVSGFKYREIAEKLGLPLIFCLALGSNLGGHSGSLPLSIIAQQYTLLSNRIPVIGVGNEADQRHHFYSEIMNTSDTKTVEIRVGENTSGFVMELWTELPNILSISLTSPSGESTSRIPIRAGTSTTFNFLFENTTVYIDYRLFVESTASELIHFRFSDAAPGIWKLVVEPVQIIDGRFHIWLPVREFLSGEVYFLNSNPYYTLTAPSDSVQPISVSYYDSSNNGLALSSGRGFTRTEQVKPDFTAPGISITGALPGGQFESRSGSSTSVGITAGAAALLVEWHLQQKKIPSVSTALIKSLLTLGATRNPDMKYPNREWGYGQLNLYNTFEAMRQL